MTCEDQTRKRLGPYAKPNTESVHNIGAHQHVGGEDPQWGSRTSAFGRMQNLQFRLPLPLELTRMPNMMYWEREDLGRRAHMLSCRAVLNPER